MSYQRRLQAVDELVVGTRQSGRQRQLIQLLLRHVMGLGSVIKLTRVPGHRRSVSSTSSTPGSSRDGNSWWRVSVLRLLWLTSAAAGWSIAGRYRSRGAAIALGLLLRRLTCSFFNLLELLDKLQENRKKIIGFNVYECDFSFWFYAHLTCLFITG